VASSGIDLAASYWKEVVAPLLSRRLPGMQHTAGRLGGGSEVLGLDDATSRDHDWGLRLTLLVPSDQVRPVREILNELPETFAGLPTRFATTWDPIVSHRVEVTDPVEFVTERLGVDPTVRWGPVDWLSLTGQAVLEVTAGPVFVDTDGRISKFREALAWYPDDLWLHVIACDWQRIDQELPFLGRTGQRGDDVGSRVITARLVRAAVHLGFLLERRWAPYSKWAGSVFRTLPEAGGAWPALNAALSADTWPEREAAIWQALDLLLELQRALGLPAPQSATQPFFDRPFRTVSHDLVPTLLQQVQDPAVRALPHGIGAIEQWVDNVDVLARPHMRRTVAAAAFASATLGSSQP
jgi:hypothetical protein